jgi:pyruvate dehydrogenase (quinone)
MKAPIRPQSVVLQASELAYNDAIFVGEVGEVTVWVARHLRIRGNQRLIGSFSHGSLGVGLPAAIGAQFAYPERQVIALCGDGAFSMLMGDFMVAVQYNLPLTAVVLNNSKYGFIELEMEAAGFPRFATGLENPSFAQFAKACGGEGIAVEEPGDLKASLSQAFASKQPTIVDVQVNPTELIIPPDLKPKDAWQFTQGKVKEMFREKDLSVLFER